MASNIDFVEYVCGQISHAGEITYKKMFGDYGVYCDGKFFALICDNQFFIKITNTGQALNPHQETGLPYPGASPYFLISDLEDPRTLCEFVKATCDALPEPKPKKIKKRPA